MSESLNIKRLRYSLSLLCAIAGLALIFIYARPPVSFRTADESAWSVAPNGEFALGIGFANPGKFYLYLITDDNQKILLQEGFYGIDYASISPDSTMIAFLPYEQGSSYLEILDPTGRQERVVHLDGYLSSVIYVAWAQDSDSLLIAGRLQVGCEERNRCYWARVVRYDLNSSTIEPLLEADCSTPPYDQGCLYFHNPPRSMLSGLFLRNDGEAYYLMASLGEGWQWFILPTTSLVQENFPQYQLAFPAPDIPPESFVYESNQQNRQRLPFEVELRDYWGDTLLFEDHFVRMIALGCALLILSFCLGVILPLVTNES